MRSLSIVSSLVIADTALAEEANWRDVTIVQNSKLNVALSVLSEDGAVDGARTSRVQIEQTGKSNWAYTIQNFTIPYVEPVSGGDGDPMPMTPRRNAADDRTTATVVQRGQVNKASLYQNSPNNAALISQSARRGGGGAPPPQSQARNFRSFLTAATITASRAVTLTSSFCLRGFLHNQVRSAVIARPLRRPK
jgi:hypothetical protein